MRAIRSVAKPVPLLFASVLVYFIHAVGAAAPQEFGLFTTLSAHNSPVYSLALSPNGKMLASAGADNTVLIWNTDTWQIVRRLSGEFGSIHVLVFKPDGSTLAAGTDIGTVRLWDTTTWVQNKIVSAHSKEVRAMVFSKHGDQLITTGRDVKRTPLNLIGRAGAFFTLDKTDDVIKIWDTTDWSISKRLMPLTSKITALDFNLNEQFLASGEENGKITIFDSKTWTEVESLEYPRGAITGLAFEKNGTRLVAAGLRSGLIFWSTDDWSISHTLEGPTVPVRTMDFNFVKSQMVLASGKGTVSLLSDMGTTILERVQNRLNFNKAINTVRFNSDGHVLIFGIKDGTIKVAQPIIPVPLSNVIVEPSRPIIVPTPSLSVLPPIEIPIPVVTTSITTPSNTLGLTVFIGIMFVIMVWVPRIFLRSRRRRVETRRLEEARVEAENQERLRVEAENRERLRIEAEAEAKRKAEAMIEAQRREKARIKAKRLAEIQAESIRREEIRRNEAVIARNQRTIALDRGYVYLLKAGPYYKIGKSKDAERRVREIKLQLPYDVKKLHVIETENMTKLEAFWHLQFKEKRANGEWFLLSDNDVLEFQSSHEIP